MAKMVNDTHMAQLEALVGAQRRRKPDAKDNQIYAAVAGKLAFMMNPPKGWTAAYIHQVINGKLPISEPLATAIDRLASGVYTTQMHNSYVKGMMERNKPKRVRHRMQITFDTREELNVVKEWLSRDERAQYLVAAAKTKRSLHTF